MLPAMSQTDPHQAEIDGHTYTMYMLDPFVASDWAVRLSKIFGPALGDLAGALAAAEAGESGFFATKLEPNKVSDAIAGVFSRMQSNDVRELVTALGGQTELHLEGDQRVKLDNKQASNHFKGRVGAMYRFMKWGIEVQFADFFEGLRPLLATAQEMMIPTNSKSPSPPDDTASSGD